MLANTETIMYVIEVRQSEDLQVEGREYWCTVLVGDVEIVEAGNGVAKEEIQTKGAEAAVRILKARKVAGDCVGEDMVVDVVKEHEEREVDADVDMNF